MAGRIRNEDVVLVRERARIDEVVREHVSLKSAGGASLKGLCPFHDEKSPSFHVTPSKGFWYCFGCGEGGDVIGFLQKILLLVCLLLLIWFSVRHLHLFYRKIRHT